MNVLLNDPPREREEGSSAFVSLQQIQQQADIISFHVPLNLVGIDRTFHMVDSRFLQDLGKSPLLTNTCRGEVFDTKAVHKAIASRGLSGLIIDCWENEPELDLDLLDLTDYATAHIAGYSRDGKANGTRSSVRAISKFFGLGIDDWEPSGVAPPKNPVIELDGIKQAGDSILAQAILSTYNIENDDKALRENPHLFEQLRGDYPPRREFGSYSIKASHIEVETLEMLQKLGFKLIQN